MSRSSPPKPGGARTGQGEGDTPPFDEEVSGTQHRDGHVPMFNENMTHPRALPQRADSPSTRDSDRDHQMKPGNDHIRKHTSGKPSLKRRPLLVELF